MPIFCRLLVYKLHMYVVLFLQPVCTEAEIVKSWVDQTCRRDCAARLEPRTPGRGNAPTRGARGEALDRVARLPSSLVICPVEGT